MSPSAFAIARPTFALALLIHTTALTEGALAEAGIGTATSIVTSVSGDATALKTGDAVFQDQTIVTDATGVGQFEFADKTKLAIGPGSTLILDNFVYDSATSSGSVVINLTAGALRFMTGKAHHDAYTIVTPAATIGVRGTAFDIYADKSGELALAMIDGAVEVCPRGGACRVHNVIGRFLHMTPAGLFSLHDKWDGSFFTGVPFKLALPFLSDQRTLLPALRGKTATIRRYVDATVRGIKAPRLKLPNLRLPNPFK